MTEWFTFFKFQKYETTIAAQSELSRKIRLEKPNVQQLWLSYREMIGDPA